MNQAQSLGQHPNQNSTVRREGDQAPAVHLCYRAAGEWQTADTKALFANRTVVLFALPGAFTPTCSATHVPRYNELADTFRANGVDEIVCLSVNDPFVMESWQRDQRAENVTFLPDGNAEFTRAMGMLVTKSDLNFGDRSWRYSMLVRDGVIEKLFVEPDEPGDPFVVSDADTMLDYINPSATTPTRITLFGKQGCAHCTRAKQALTEHGYAFEEIELGQGSLSLATLTAVSGQTTTPQVYVEGARVGGADELEVWLQQQTG